jgi:hypothetical protein
VTYEIEPIAEHHISGFHATLDAVAREQKSFRFWKRRPLSKCGILF